MFLMRFYICAVSLYSLYNLRASPSREIRERGMKQISAPNNIDHKSF